MSDTINDFRALKDIRKAERRQHGIECEDCKRLLPKARPSILMPGQKCRTHNFSAPRKDGF